jgi:excinuclease ABC subunit C
MKGGPKNSDGEHPQEMFMTHLAPLGEHVGTFPRLPGVYLMRDADGKVIYVGKAKDLRARVRSYFLGGDGRLQIAALLERIRAVENIVTENEEQAFVLERDLISKYKPRYNIRLKDDKSFLSVRVDTDAPWPRLELVRKRFEDDNARYFGPYSSSAELKAVLEIIKRVVPLRTCADTVFYNRQRPCLEYQIKRCAGPCCLPVDPEEYRRWVKQAISILQGRFDALLEEFEQQMERASSDLRFEDAATIRDRIDVLQSFKRGNSLTSYSGEDRDVFGLYREEGLAALAVMKVRGGRLGETQNFSFTDLSISNAQVLESAIEQLYEGGREVPSEIVVGVEPDNLSIVTEALRRRTGRAVEVAVPQRGVKARLLALAETNARHFFSSRFDAETRYQEIASSLAQRLNLRQIPRRIEVVDISNFQGSDIVGALVSFFDGVSDKRGYRKYKITSKDTQDDFASVFEVVSRRLSRGLADGDLPDLLVIDGGPGQLAKAIAAREVAKVDLEIVALAKQRTLRDRGSAKIQKSNERIFLPSSTDPIELPDGSELTRFMQRMRDEAHRFVITFHRKTRSKRVFRSILDDVPGLGVDRRNRLLKHFGQVQKISEAPIEEIARIGKMPKAMAEKVVEYLQESLSAKS